VLTVVLIGGLGMVVLAFIVAQIVQQSKENKKSEANQEAETKAEAEAEAMEEGKAIKEGKIFEELNALGEVTKVIMA
jgi:flagellar biosynthesis/type III secretory pathway M-ring protein FliF/YscJ